MPGNDLSGVAVQFATQLGANDTEFKMHSVYRFCHDQYLGIMHGYKSATVLFLEKLFPACV